MREYKCDGCGKELQDREEVRIQTQGTVIRQQDGYSYLTEHKVLICGDCR